MSLLGIRSSLQLLAGMATSYGNDLRQWLKGLGTRYATGIGLMAGGVLLIIGAAGVGTAAALHYFEMRYGASIAYAIIGGTYCVLGTAGLVAGRALLGKPAAPAPSPQRQLQILKRMLPVSTAASFLPSNRREVSGPDLVTRTLATAAAVTLLGWVALSQFQRRRGRDQ